MNETILQQQIVIWFNNQYCRKCDLSHENRYVVLSIPNESINAIETKRKLNTGLLVGASDLVLLFPNEKTVFCEIKYGKNTQSQSQKDFQARVQALGFEYWLIYSLDQFKDAVQSYIHRLESVA